MTSAGAGDQMGGRQETELPWRERLAERLRLKKPIFIESLAEFLGTFVLLFIGYGCVAQAVFNKALSGGPTGPDLLGIRWGWTMAVAMGVWVSAGVSGAHLNPAITFTMAVLGKLEWKKVPGYWIAQYWAGFVASFSTYILYYDALNNFDGGIRQVIDHENATAGIWATYPQPYLSISTGVLDQLIGTAMFVLCACAVTDSRNAGAPTGVTPIVLGLALFGIGEGFGFNCGYAINPARDLPARIFTAIAGWGCTVFTVRNYWFWVPAIVPHFGALIGALLYSLCIGIHIPAKETNVKVNSSTSHQLEMKYREKITPVDMEGIVNTQYLNEEPAYKEVSQAQHGIQSQTTALRVGGVEPEYLIKPNPLDVKLVNYAQRM